MKRLSLVILALLAFCALMALDVVAVESSALRSSRQSDSLYRIAKSLSAEGIEVYYYNETGFVLGLSGSAQERLLAAPLQRIALSGANKLYLITKLPDLAIPADLDIVQDLGEAVLIRSSLSDVQLREQILHPFVELELLPMRFPEERDLQSSLRDETMRSITELTQAVNQDTIMSYIQRLQDFSTRYALADNRLVVASWIRDQFLRYGISNAHLQQFNWNNTVQYNVVATIPGSISPDEYIVVGGHHDSITGTTPYNLAPGADDNASGAVAALEMARVMMLTGYQPKCSIRFVTFAAEEFGLWGSKFHAQTAFGANENIRLMINHDMLANSNENPSNWRVRLMPYDGFWNESAFAAQMTSDYTSLNPVYGSTNSSSSDSHPFWQLGYPVIYFFEYDFCPWYHSDLDIVANINPAYCTEVIKASVASAAGVAQMPASPPYLQVQDSGTGSSLLASWGSPADPDVVGYNVYYGANGSGLTGPVFVQGNSLEINSLSEGIEYQVRVASVDANQNESYRLSALGTPRSIPVVPQNFAETPIADGIVISWEPNTELDLAGYVLYRSLNPDTAGAAIHQGLLTATSYTDTNVDGATGYYYYTLRAVDTSAQFSAYTESISSRPITLDQGILIVDETKNLSGTNMFQLTDLQADSFYSNLMQDYRISHWDTEAETDFLRLADLGIYSSILWHGNDISDMDHPYIVREALKSYLDAGGNILFSVMVPSQAFELSSTYPATFNGSTFINQYLGISGVSYNNNARFNGAISAAAGMPNLPIDANKVPSTWSGHIFRVEGMTAPGEILYNYGSAYADGTNQGSLNGMAVGVMKTRGNSKAITLSFPLFYVEDAPAREFINQVFAGFFGEPVSNDDLTSNPGPGLLLGSAYPNPFSRETSFRVSSDLPAAPLRVEIYNLRGQKVKTLFNGPQSTRASDFTWDGRDDQARNCSSGIYFLKVSQGGQQRIGKLLLCK